MDENFSPVIFLYGMALIVAVGKAFTLLIWRTLPKPRPPLRQEVVETWRRRKAGLQATKEAARKPPTPPSIVEEVSSDPGGGKDSPRPVVSVSDASVTESVSDRPGH
jgi:hypothetical protein